MAGWRLKARIQRAIAALPPIVGNPAYYALQRTVGAFRAIDPLEHFTASASMITAIHGAGGSVRGASVFEVGTGHRLNVPLAFWLAGTRKTRTADLNRYLKGALVDRDLRFVRDHPDRVRASLDPENAGHIDSDRLDRLTGSPVRFSGLLELMQLEYVAPSDAARTSLDDGAFDLHISRSVLEHVDPRALEDILSEGKRLVSSRGLLVHYVDFSDHFAHSDPTISSVNFLRFGEEEWHALAGNRFMYHNRLRYDDYLDVFRRLGLAVITEQRHVDDRAVQVLRQGFPLDRRFRGKPVEVLATSSALFALAAGSHERGAGEDGGPAAPVRPEPPG